MTTIPESARLELLRRHGGFPVAYSVAMQPGLSHFGDEHGFLSYLTVGRTAFVLADPLCPSERADGLIAGFLADYPDACFCQISHRTAQRLDARGLSVNEFGEERSVDLTGFAFAGPRLRSFRTAENRLGGSFTVREARFSDEDPTLLTTVSERWRATKVNSRRELRLLVRPMVIGDEPGVRKFLLHDGEGAVKGFASFDPVYEDGQVTGYLAATRRWLPDVDGLAGYLMMKRAVEAFQRDGVTTLHLGLSPFHRIEDKEFTKDWLTRRVFIAMYKNALINRFVYPTRSLSAHKEMYGGTARQTYFALTKTPSWPRLFKLLRAMGIV